MASQGGRRQFPNTPTAFITGLTIFANTGYANMHMTAWVVPEPKPTQCWYAVYDFSAGNYAGNNTLNTSSSCESASAVFLYPFNPLPRG